MRDVATIHTRRIDFHSSDSTTSSARPKLAIDYHVLPTLTGNESNSGGFGETDNYLSVSFDNPDMNTIANSFYSGPTDTGPWSFLKGVTGTATTTTPSNPFEMWHIGHQYWKVDWDDQVGHTGTWGPFTMDTVEADDTAVQYYAGDDEQVFRTDTSNYIADLKVVLYDTDASAPIDLDLMDWWMNKGSGYEKIEDNYTTDATGISYLMINPNASYSLGPRNWYVTFDGNTSYKSSSSAPFHFDLLDFLPTLTSEGVTPTESNGSATFNFTVTYTDLDNNTPESGYPILNLYNNTGMTLDYVGSPYTMNKVNSSDINYTDGVQYYYLLNIPDHNTDYTFVITARASAGNTSEINTTPQNLPDVDTIPPPAPTPGSPIESPGWTRDNTPLINNYAVVDDGVGGVRYQYQINATNGTWGNLGMATSFTTEILPDGNHTVYMRAFDSVNNPSGIGHVNVSIDTAAPVASGASVIIDNGSIFTDKSYINVSWTGFTDPAPSSGIKGYYFNFTNQEGTLIGNYTTSNWIIMTNPPQGNVTVYIWAEDNAGNIGLAANATIFVDYAPVTFWDPEPVSMSWHNTDQLVCNITIRDINGTGVNASSIEYNFTSNSWTGSSGWLSAGGTDDNTTVTISVGPLTFGEGTGNYIRWRATDVAGNGPVESAAYQYYVDLTPPDESGATVIIEGGDTYATGSTIDISWSGFSDGTGIGIAGYYYAYIDNGATTNGEYTIGTTGQLAYMKEGIQTVYVWAIDSLGHIGLSASDSIIVDTISPDSSGATVLIEGGADNITSTSLNFIWSGFSDGAGSGIEGYYYSFSDNSGSETGTWDITSPGNLPGSVQGLVTIYVWAKDNAGNIGLAGEDSIFVDTVVPSHGSGIVTIESGTTYVNFTSLSVSWSGFSDGGAAGSGIKGYYYSFINKEGTSDGSWTTGTSGTVNAASEGWITVYVWAKDHMGNIGLAASDFIFVDTTPPSPTSATISIDSGATYATDASLDISWSGFLDTAGSGIKNYYVSFIDKSGTENGDAVFGTTGSLSGAVEGTVTVYVWARDQAGNIGLAASDSIFVDTLAPEHASAWILIETGDAYTLDTTLDFTFGGFDDHGASGSGISQYYFGFTDEGGNPSLMATTASPDSISGASEGTVNVWIWGRDNAGNIGLAVTDDIFVDTWVPDNSGAWTVIEDDHTYTNKTSLEFSFGGFDDNVPDGSGITGYYYDFTNGSGTTTGTTDTGSPGILAGAADGEATVFVWAEDLVGHVGNAVNDSIIVDTHAPYTAPSEVYIDDNATFSLDTTLDFEWTPFTDQFDLLDGAGIAGYYYSYTNQSGSVVSNHSSGGLLGQYYDGVNFNDLSLTRLDPVVDFSDNGVLPPWNFAITDHYSARWTGSVFAPEDGSYRFWIEIDDGGRLWIDGIQVINSWTGQSPTWHSGLITLNKGFHDLRLEYYENGGGAQIRMGWQKPTGSFEIIPQENLWCDQLYDGTLTDAVPQGTQPVYLWAQDRAGNVGDAIESSIIVDTLPPYGTGALMTINDGVPQTTRQVLDIEWSGFTDTNGSGIAGYYYGFTDGSGTNSGFFSDTLSGSLTAEWGQYTVYVWAVDALGHIGSAIYDTIEVLRPDIGNVSYPDTINRGENLTIRGIGADIDPGIEQIDLTWTFRITNPAGTIFEPAPVFIADDNGSRAVMEYWEAVWPVPLFSQSGKYNLQARYANPGGELSPWYQGSFQVNNNNPWINESLILTGVEDTWNSFSLEQLALDIEDNSTLLSWAVLGYDNDNISGIDTTYLKNHILRILPKSDFFGKLFINLRVVDLDGGVDEGTILINILNVNDPPRIFEIPGALQLVEDTPAPDILNLSQIFVDPEDNPLSFTVTGQAITNRNLAAQINSTGELTLIPGSNQTGVSTITIAASDSISQSVSITLNLTILPVNDAPMINRTPGVMTIIEDTWSNTTLDLNDIFIDNDSTLKFSISNTQNFSYELDVQNNIRFKPVDNWTGEDIIVLRAIDDHDRLAALELTISVTPVNDAPVADIGHIFPVPQYLGRDIAFSGTSYDAEDDIVSSYQWTSDIDGYLSGEAAFSTDNLSLGIHTISLIATDSNGKNSISVSQIIKIVAPDVVITDLSFSSETITEGDSIDITVQISNSGTGISGTLELVISDGDSIIETILIDPLSPDESQTYTILWEPGKGSHSITASITDQDNYEDPQPENNQFSTSVSVRMNVVPYVALAIIILIIIVCIVLFVVYRRRLTKEREAIMQDVEKQIYEARKLGIHMDNLEQEFREMADQNHYRSRLLEELGEGPPAPLPESARDLPALPPPPPKIALQARLPPASVADPSQQALPPSIISDDVEEIYQDEIIEVLEEDELSMIDGLFDEEEGIEEEELSMEVEELMTEKENPIEESGDSGTSEGESIAIEEGVFEMEDEIAVEEDRESETGGDESAGNEEEEIEDEVVAEDLFDIE